ncbi:MAG: J domain-containing protein [Planctomycetota bacterium]
MSSKPRASHDPWTVLGLSPDASDTEIRRAYLAAIRKHGPDTDPEAFQAIRSAYEIIEDPLRRAKFRKLFVDVEAPLVDMLRSAPRSRRFIGPKRWLKVLEEPSR